MRLFWDMATKARTAGLSPRQRAIAEGFADPS